MHELVPGVELDFEPSHKWLSRIADLPKSPIAHEVEERLSSELLLSRTSPDFSRQLVEVTSTYGFAVIHNPEIDDSLFDETYSVMEELFAQGPEYLEQFGRPGVGRDDGYIPPATEVSTSASGKTQANVFQFIHRVADLSRNKRINDELGRTFQEKSDAMITALYKELEETCRSLAIGLRDKNFRAPDGNSILPDDFFTDLMRGHDGSPSELTLARLTHCHAVDLADREITGCSMAHTDLNFVTILPRPTSPLQLWYNDKQNPENSGYVELKTPPASFTLNMGDQAEILTGGYLQSTPHRVIAPVGVDRYSIILFGGLRKDVDLLKNKLTQPDGKERCSRFEQETLPRISSLLTAEIFTELRKSDIGLISAEEAAKLGFKALSR